MFKSWFSSLSLDTKFYILGVLILIVGFSLLWFISFLYSPKFRGIKGEFLVKLHIFFRLNSRKYKVIHNVTLPLKRGGSTQIDHIIISIFGVFVIETKNYKGWIYGNEKQREWTQVFYNKQRYKFQNPLQQNSTHISVLQRLLDIPEKIIYSVVVFTGEAEFKTEMPKNICKKDNFIRYIKSYRQKILSKQDVNDIYYYIQESRLNPSFITDYKHIQYVKKQQALRDKKRSDSK